MENKYEISGELRKSTIEFLCTASDYEKCLENLKNDKKLAFTEGEVNEILNLLGSFRLRDVFQLVERFKVEITPLKPVASEPTNNTPEQAG